MHKLIIALILTLQIIYSVEHYYYQNNQTKMLTPVPQSIVMGNKTIYYKNEKGTVVGVTDQIIVKCKQLDCLRNYKNEFNLTIVKSLGKALYVVKVLDRSLTLNTANKLSQKDDILYAHPDFIKKHVPR